MVQTQVRPKPISKRMLLVIIIALLFILLPACIVGVPFSTLKVTVVNMGDFSASVSLRVYGASEVKYEYFNLDPGNTESYSFGVHPGTYEISVTYQYYDPYASGYGWESGNTYRTVSVGYLQTQETTISISPS